MARTVSLVDDRSGRAAGGELGVETGRRRVAGLRRCGGADWRCSTSTGYALSPWTCKTGGCVRVARVWRDVGIYTSSVGGLMMSSA